MAFWLFLFGGKDLDLAIVRGWKYYILYDVVNREKGVRNAVKFIRRLLFILVVKTGTCPLVAGLGPCDMNCTGDSKCPGKQKCCSNGCGLTCTGKLLFETLSVDLFDTTTSFLFKGQCMFKETFNNFVYKFGSYYFQSGIVEY